MAKSLVRNFSQLSSRASRSPPLASRYVTSDLCGFASRPPSWVGSVVSFPGDVTEPAPEPKQCDSPVYVVSMPDPTALYEAYSRESDQVGVDPNRRRLSAMTAVDRPPSPDPGQK